MNLLYHLKRVYSRAERDILKQSKLLFPPAQVKINTGYVCNIECPLCPTGVFKSHKAEQLTIEAIKFIHSRIGNGFKISLYGWGEPFLNKDIFKIIKYLKTNNFLIEMNSNLNIKEELVKKIEEVPFKYLSVSLDGIDQQSNSEYRRKGNYELAFNNMIRLHRSRKGPQKVVWQYLVSNKNVCYLQKAKELANKNKLSFYEMNIGLYIDIFFNHSQDLKNEWHTSQQQSIQDFAHYYAPSGSCQYMYNEPFIDTNGLVYPCCNSVYAPKELLEQGFQNVFGNLHTNTLLEIWNSEYYQFMRSKFRSNILKSNSCKPICLKCKVYLQGKGLSTESLPLFEANN